MGRPAEAARLLRKGDSPSQVAFRMGVTVSTVLGYLYRQAGEGKIQRSDIILSIPRQTRLAVEEALNRVRPPHRPYKITRWLKKRHPTVNRDDVQIYLNLMGSGVQFGDLYESIREIEMLLHSITKKTLIGKYGDAWWRKAVPQKIRVECVQRREMDDLPADDPFSYTNFIDMKKILSENWTELAEKLPEEVVRDRKEFLSKLDKLNGIRNAVMHPIKELPVSDEMFEFVRHPQRQLTAPQREVTWHTLLSNIRVDSSVQ